MSVIFSSTDQLSEQNNLKRDLQCVLVVELNESGDVVMLSPAVRSLKERLPDARITLLTSKAGSQVAPLLPWIDHVLVCQPGWRGGTGHGLFSLREDITLIEQLRSQQFSAAFIFTRVAQSPASAAYICNLAGIPYRVGFSREIRGSGLSHVSTPPADDMHQVNRNLHLLEAFGLGGTGSQVELTIPEAIEKRVRELLNGIGLKQDSAYIVLAPGADGVLSQYEAAHFAKVAHILAAQTELQLVIVGSAEEAGDMQPVLHMAKENLKWIRKFRQENGHN